MHHGITPFNSPPAPWTYANLIHPLARELLLMNSNPLYFINNMSEHFELTPAQRRIVANITENKLNLIMSSTGMGSTFVLARYCLWWTLLAPYQKVAIITPTQQMCNHMYGDITHGLEQIDNKLWLHEATDFLPNVMMPETTHSHTRLKFANSSEIHVTSVQSFPVEIRGSSVDVFILTEADHFSPKDFNDIITGMWPAVTQKFILCASTISEYQGLLRRIYDGKEGRWKKTIVGFYD